ncbi:MAG: LptF/LptG family permease [Betaproteobacteria bacterium]|nr:LptF/LptG family permease [Betaproteobacteria bacterium]
MPVLSWYFFRRVGIAAGLLWFGLTALMAALHLTVNADKDAAALLALLQTPRLALETLPFACAIGAAAALQRMEESRELQTMRAAGLSWRAVAILAAGGGAAFSAATLALGELALEPAESLARAVQNRQPTKGNIWLHKDGKFFRAEKISIDGAMQNIAVYEPQKNILRMTTAAAAKPQKDGAWLLADGEESELAEGRAEARAFTSRAWDFPFSAAALKAVVRRPREMSMRSLAAAGALRGGGIGARFAAAFWRKLASIPAPPLLTAAAVWTVGARRRVAFSVLAAAAMAGAYYLSAIMAAQFAVLFNFPPAAAAPLLLLAAFCGLAARRRFA